MVLLHNLKKASFVLVICLFTQQAIAQLSATFQTTPNTNCNGSGCDYQGPSILINEMMMSPTSFDGSLWEPNCNANARCGEWIELYNPNLCEPIDVSCFYLGNYAVDGILGYPGGYTIPPGTVIPASGFLLLRGQNATPVDPSLLVANGGNTIEIVVTTPNTCIGGGNRLWFPNAGSWFAFYDATGVPQDAVSWGSNPGSLGNNPCVTTVATCSFNGTLPTYNQIPANRKNNVYNTGALPNSWGQSLRRFPDGGSWEVNQGSTTLTPGSCNSTCIQPSASSCTGTAIISVSGGTAPYTYVWNDTQGQLTPTATGLCAGTYQVTVTDAASVQQVFTVDVEDFVPTVTVELQEQICIDGGNVAVTASPLASGSATGTISGTGISGTNFNPQTAGLGPHPITYDYTDENGCQNSATDQITVNPLPTPTIGNNASPYCISSIPAGLTLNPAGGTLSGNGVQNNDFVPSLAGVGTHTLTYNYTDANGCSNSTSIQVTVVAVDPPTLTGPNQLCIHANPEAFVGTPVGGTFALNGTNFNGTLDPATAGVGTHAVTYDYTDANGCQSVAQQSVVVLPRPTLSLAVSANYCYETNLVNLAPTPAGGTLSGVHATTTGLDLSGVDPGNYQVTYDYTDVNGCTNTITSNYSVTTPINPTISYVVDDCIQQASFVAAPLVNSNFYSWEFDGITSSNQGGIITQDFALFGTHTVELTITDPFNCSYDTLISVYIPEGVTFNTFVVPNVITPNNDQINDFLQLPALLTECYDYTILIVNRWGNVVYEMDPNGIFTGKDQNGNELSAGVYFYRVESSDFDCDEDKYKGFCHGNITIIR